MSVIGDPGESLPSILGKPSAWTLLILWVIAVLGTSCRRDPKVALDPYHPEVLHSLVESSAICPSGYELIDAPHLFKAMGMKQNPGFITNVSELEAMSRFGGSDPFLAVFG